jgi:hypothetical protein
MKKISNNHSFSEHFGYEEYEPYDGQKKIKKVSSEHVQRRQIKNWKKVWSEHENDYDEVDEFYDVRK